MKVVFLDAETTGLDPDQHEVWEVALIVPGGIPEEREWFLPVDSGRADAYALQLGRFHERHPQGVHGPNKAVADVTPLPEFARAFAGATLGKHLVGAVPSFDEERLRRLLRREGQCPGWHYHLVDVENLAAGKLGTGPPWDSEELSRAVGVDPERFDRHTALGDARWAKAIYERVVKNDPPDRNVSSESTEGDL